jgi:hypothetical protein
MQNITIGTVRNPLYAGRCRLLPVAFSAFCETRPHVTESALEHSDTRQD